MAHSLLKWTGLRGSDAADITWEAVNFETGTLRWKTLKRGVWVTIPLSGKLISVMLAQRCVSYPEPGNRIIPDTTRPKLYRLIKELGKRAGVPNCHPHRYRDHLAVDMLAKGATIYDVAKMLGDSVTTVEKHYAPFTGRLQERVRGILDSR